MTTTEHRPFTPMGADVLCGRQSSSDLEPGTAGIVTAEEEARCRQVLAWGGFEGLLDTVAGVRPELGAYMARLAVEALIPLMSAADAEWMLKQLARKIVETRTITG